MYDKLKQTIDDKGISVYKLAKMSDIHPSDMYGVFKATRPLFPSWRKRIAEALEMSEQELFEEDK